jgi:hypothetical protein
MVASDLDGSASTTSATPPHPFLLHMQVPPLEVARIPCHSSVTTTLTIYAHAIEEQTSPRAAQIMGEALRRRDR